MAKNYHTYIMNSMSHTIHREALRKSEVLETDGIAVNSTSKDERNWEMGLTKLLLLPLPLMRPLHVI